MTQPKHDPKAALDAKVENALKSPLRSSRIDIKVPDEYYLDDLSLEDIQRIRYALRVLDRVRGDASETMCIIGREVILDQEPDELDLVDRLPLGWKAMRDQLLKEVQDDQGK